MGMGFAPTWLRQVSPLLHMTTVITVYFGSVFFTDRVTYVQNSLLVT